MAKANQQQPIGVCASGTYSTTAVCAVGLADLIDWIRTGELTARVGATTPESEQWKARKALKDWSAVGERNLAKQTAAYRKALAEAAGNETELEEVRSAKASMFPAAVPGWTGLPKRYLGAAARRQAKSASRLTNLTHYDLDKVADPADTVAELSKVAGIIAAGVSPGGRGVWAWLAWANAPADAEEYKRRWETGRAYIDGKGHTVKYEPGGGADNAPSSCVSLRFIAHDPAVFFDPDAEPLNPAIVAFKPKEPVAIEIDGERRGVSPTDDPNVFLVDDKPAPEPPADGPPAAKPKAKRPAAKPRKAAASGPARSKHWLEQRLEELRKTVPGKHHDTQKRVFTALKKAGYLERDEHDVEALARDACRQAGSECAASTEGVLLWVHANIDAVYDPPAEAVVDEGDEDDRAKAEAAGFVFDDVQLANAWLKKHGDNWRWVAETDAWLRWSGQRWAPISGDPVTAGLQAMGARIYARRTKDGVYVDGRRGSQRSVARSALGFLRETDGIKTAAADWDAAPNHLDNVVGLPRGKLIEVRDDKPAGLKLWTRDRTRADMVTRETNAAPESRIGGTWHEHVTTLFDDDDTYSVFHRLMGAGLLGRAKETFALFIGAGGTGKTVTCEAILRAVGSYGASIAEEAVWGRLSGHSTARTEFRGRRFAVVEEGPPQTQLDTAFVKKLTGGSKVDARRMRENVISFRFDGLLILISNHNPVMNIDSGIMRRMRVFRFEKRRYPEGGKPDRDWLSKVHLGDVMSWLVDGAALFLEQGLGDSDSVDEATDDVARMSDPLCEFIADRLAFIPKSIVPLSDVHAVYHRWLAESGCPGEPLSRQGLATKLTETDARIKRAKKGETGARLAGVALKS